MYNIKTTKTFDKELSRLPSNFQLRVVKKINELAKNPHAKNNNLKALKGYENAYRLRVGDYRIIYEIHNNELIIVILKIGSREGVYK